MEASQQNASAGERLVEPLGIVADNPLKQTTSADWRQPVRGQQVRQALGVVQEPLALPALAGVIGQQ